MHRFAEILSYILAVGLLLPPRSVESSSAGGRPLREHVRIAGYAFAGTVDSMRTVRLPTVVTLVHLSRLEVAKGDTLADTLTLRMYGGIYGGQEYELLGAPRFEVGARYVLLTSKDLGVEPYYMPVGRNTFYPLRSDSVTGVPVVHDSEARPVVAVSAGHIVVLERRFDSPVDHTNPIPPSERVTEVRYRDEDTGERMSEAEFLSAIRELVKTERTK
jgi:hypothetical protein